jgi:CBS domain-containing protein
VKHLILSSRRPRYTKDSRQLFTRQDGFLISLIEGGENLLLTVRDVLKTKKQDIWTITPQSTAYQALEIMADQDIGALIVIDNDQIVGIFSERDYARKVILKGKSSKETAVGELMTAPVFSIEPEKSVEKCMSLMTVTHNRHLPVMKEGKLLGVVSIGDVVNALIIIQKIEIEDLKSYVAKGGYYSEWTAS